MVIASWNVNSVKARLPHLNAFLTARAPDVLLLQELKGTDFPALDFEALGYKSVAVTQKAYNGVAVLSKFPIETLRTTLPGDETDSHARFLEVAIEGLRILNIYLPNGNPVGTDKFSYKMTWMERLAAHMSGWRDAEMPSVVGGDFNVIPEEADCSKPADWLRDALFQPETRARYRALLALGFTDAFRALYPDATGKYTFWDYFRNAFERNRGIRIDHFLLSAAAAERLVACEIDTTPRAQERPSDHTPILITLR